MLSGQLISTFRSRVLLLSATLALVGVGVLSGPVGAQEAIVLANDGRSLARESFETRATFVAVHGSRAAMRWVTEHEAELAVGTTARPMRVSLLSQATVAAGEIQRDVLVQTLAALGWRIGKDLVFDWHYAANTTDPLDSAAAEIVRQQPDLILAAASAPALALTRATSTIPIVVNSLGDPLSLVASIEHPGGNLTGSLQTPPGFNQTKLNLVHEALPGVTRLAILRSTTNPFPAIFDEMKAAAERNGMVVQSISVRNFPDDVPAAIDEAVAGTAGAILQVPDGTFSAADTQRIAERAMQNRIPYIAAARAGVVSAGLMSFEPGTLPNAPIRVAAEYVDKILKGAKPGDLAMRGPSGTLITLNEKTARAIGVTLPASVLAKASEILR